MKNLSTFEVSMKKDCLNTRTYKAIFLLLLLVSSMWIKPIHILFVDHAKFCTTSTNQDQTEDSHEKNCPICNFEFCPFTPQEIIEIPNAVCYTLPKLIVREADRLINPSFYYFNLRAPPFLV